MWKNQCCSNFSLKNMFQCVCHTISSPHQVDFIYLLFILKRKSLALHAVVWTVAQLHEWSLPCQTGGSGCMLVFSNAWPSVTPTCAWWQKHFVLNYVVVEMTWESGVLPSGVTTFPYQHKHWVSLPATPPPPPCLPATPPQALSLAVYSSTCSPETHSLSPRL